MVWDHDITKPEQLRSSEMEIVILEESDQYVAVFDLRNITRLSSGLGICTTLFVCFILAAGALMFSRDSNELVIAPIEAMIMKINKIA